MKKRYIIGTIIAVASIITALDYKRHKEVQKEKIEKEPESKIETYYETTPKRTFDVVCSIAALTVFSPIYLIVALLVKLKLGSPIIFKQKRPGKNGEVFELYKFRTMTDEKDENGNLLPDKVRLTSFGKWLRSTSLDELPEALNILKGDMSIIGPRPQLVRDLVFMDDEQKKRHEVKPGLSGLAQVNGRNAIKWEDKLNYDLEYIRNISFFEDLRIIFETIKKAFIKQEGITEDDMATAEDFGDYLLRTGKVTEEEYEAKQEEAKEILLGKDKVLLNGKKKVLIVASVISFIEWFNKENIDFLSNNLNCEVHIAVNADYMDDTNEDRTIKYLERIKQEGVIVHNIKFARSPFSFINLKCYMNLKELISVENFDVVHTHTPTVSMLTRLAANKYRKQGTTVMYTCHGFHFHNSSSKINWLIYYPIEKILSKFTDYLVTINKEDYNRAKKFYCSNVKYIPGVGVNLEKIKNTKINKEKYKEQLGIPSNSILVLSVGEMIERKNHEVIIRALSLLNDNNIYYAIAGKGPLKQYLEDLTFDLNISENILFLGFRTDIPELCQAADIGAFPSKIEGLGLAGIEAMAAGTPLVSSNVHGILDYVVNGKTGYACNPNNPVEFAKAIGILANDYLLRKKMEINCINAVKPFELNNALNEMWKIYKEVILKE